MGARALIHSGRRRTGRATLIDAQPSIVVVLVFFLLLLVVLPVFVFIGVDAVFPLVVVEVLVLVILELVVVIVLFDVFLFFFVAKAKDSVSVQCRLLVPLAGRSTATCPGTSAKSLSQKRPRRPITGALPPGLGSSAPAIRI